MTLDEAITLLKDRIGKRIEPSFFAHDTDRAAIGLIGAYLLYEKDGEIKGGGQIIETEAYCQHDRAAHCYAKDSEIKRLEKGRIPSRMHDAMYGEAGDIYVYSNSEWCCLNFVCGPMNFGAGVLIRSIVPCEEFKDQMRKARLDKLKRKALHDHEIASGPMRVCQSLGIGHELNGKPLNESGIFLFNPSIGPEEIITDHRWGISKKQKPADEYVRRYILPKQGQNHQRRLSTKSLSIDPLTDIDDHLKKVMNDLR